MTDHAVREFVTGLRHPHAAPVDLHAPQPGLELGEVGHGGIRGGKVGAPGALYADSVGASLGLRGGFYLAFSEVDGCIRIGFLAPPPAGSKMPQPALRSTVRGGSVGAGTASAHLVPNLTRIRGGSMAYAGFRLTELAGFASDSPGINQPR